MRHKYLVLMESGCWIWWGGLNSSGYGRHRQMYERHRGQIPAGMELDHLCEVRPCVNPDHLEVVTRSENLRRKNDRGCVNGHRWTVENTLITPGATRVCRTCNAAKSRRRRERDRLAAAA